MYSIQVKTKTGDTIGEFTNFKDLTFGKMLNSYGSCSFKIPVSDPKINSLIALRVYEIYIYRDDSLVWSGEMALDQTVLSKDAQGWVQVTAYTWIQLLTSMYTGEEVTYTTTDAGQIAWGIIDTAQSRTNGDLGIVQGYIEATTNRSIIFKNDEVFKSIVALADASNGFEFDITNDKIFQVYRQMGIDRSKTILFEYGVNVANATITRDFYGITNKAIVIGSLTDGTSSREDRDATTSQSIYGIRESRINVTEEVTTALLQDAGDEYLRIKKQPLYTLSFEQVPNTYPNITNYSLGDIVKFKAELLNYSLSLSLRIRRWTVNLSNANEEKVSLDVSVI